MSEYQERTPPSDSVSASNASKPPTSKGRSGYCVRARSTNSGTRSIPLAASPHAAKKSVHCPGPHPASSTGPVRVAAQLLTRARSDGCVEVTEPKRSTYSRDLATYDSRTVSPGRALVFAMPSMIVDGVLQMPNADRHVPTAGPRAELSELVARETLLPTADEFLVAAQSVCNECSFRSSGRLELR